MQFLVYILPLGSGSVDPHIFSDPDPDPGSQNLADPIRILSTASPLSFYSFPLSFYFPFPLILFPPLPNPTPSPLSSHPPLSYDSNPSLPNPVPPIQLPPSCSLPPPSYSLPPHPIPCFPGSRFHNCKKAKVSNNVECC